MIHSVNYTFYKRTVSISLFYWCLYSVHVYIINLKKNLCFIKGQNIMHINMCISSLHN